MNESHVDRIAAAVLYEGYILYPYRPSLKNRQRWTFGGLCPRAYSEAQGGSEAWANQTQCLVAGDRRTRLRVRVRFLHLMMRTVGRLAVPLDRWPEDGEPVFEPVEMLTVGDTRFQSWQEAVEREICVAESSLGEITESTHTGFRFPPRREIEPLRESAAAPIEGLLVRRQQPLEGAVRLTAEPVADGLFRVTVQVFNQSPLEHAAGKTRDEALMRSLVSTHTILETDAGEFVSLIDPPDAWREFASACRNEGTWPVLAGEEGSTAAMLSSPIILYDYPKVAPESPGDFFDCTEIDELLTLRVMTLTDDEKCDMRSVDARTRALLERTEAFGDAGLRGLHGAIRQLRPFVEEQE